MSNSKITARKYTSAKLFSALEDMKRKKTSYESGSEFIEKIRKEWQLFQHI